MSGMFAGCEKMTSLDFSKFSTGKVWNFAYMLSGCTTLESITWGNDFDTHYAEDFEGMFQGCGSLKQLDLSFFDMRSATNIQVMFNECAQLENLDFSSCARGHLDPIIAGLFRHCRNMKELKLNPEFVFTSEELDNTSWGGYAFENVAADVDGCTIHCSEDFMNILIGRDDEFINKVTWKDATTGDIMTPQAQ